MRELGVIPGEAPKPAWRHQVGMRYKIGDTGSKGKAPAKPQGGARPQPEANSPGSNESSSSSKSAGKAPMLDPKTGKPIRHDSPIEPPPRPPQPRAPPPDTVPEQEAGDIIIVLPDKQIGKITVNHRMKSLIFYPRKVDNDKNSCQCTHNKNFHLTESH